jgi:hypothetical protein
MRAPQEAQQLCIEMLSVVLVVLMHICKNKEAIAFQSAIYNLITEKKLKQTQ